MSTPRHRRTEKNAFGWKRLRQGAGERRLQQRARRRARSPSRNRRFEDSRQSFHRLLNMGGTTKAGAFVPLGGRERLFAPWEEAPLSFRYPTLFKRSC